ncbi:MAG: phosphoglycerate dehydrogenase [Thermodesulfobacteriota bacterium]
MYRVMIRDNMDPVAREILESTGQIQVTVDNRKETGSPEAVAEWIGQYHGIAVRSGTQLSAGVLEKAGQLKVVGRAGIGVDNIDVAAATRQGIVVMNAPGGNTVTTGEHAIALLLSLARNIPQATASIRAGRWEKKQLTGIEITGKTIGVIGLGHIGRIVASRAKGLLMNVIASDPFVSPASAREMGVELVPLEDLLRRSDFISLHVPRMKETLNMINAETLRMVKPGVRIINCSRGEVVNLDDLHRALENGTVAGAALDVLPKEPPDPSLPILQHPRVIFTPHLGASTDEAQVKVAQMIATQMADYLCQSIIVNAVNFPSISKEVLEKIRPHLILAEKMGSLMGQMSQKACDITISYNGDMARLDTRPLTHAVLKGLLSSFTDEPVNDVSAPSLAAEKGIHFKETTSSLSDDFAGLIKIKLEGCEDAPNEIWGTVFSKKHPRIVRFGEIYMDAIPEGDMLIVQNIDRPGVIGNLGTTLGRHQINIARFQLGRRGDRALCMVNIDTPADESVIEDIRRLPNILSVCQVRL